jgi:hypothetical protein
MDSKYKDHDAGCATKHVDMVKSLGTRWFFKIGNKRGPKGFGHGSPIDMWAYHRQELAFERTQLC